jgi:signal transduction histidine kinase/HAMP domain-containing protein
LTDALIRRSRRRYSIGAKIFGAFVIMGMITGALGGYGLYVLWSAGHIVVHTYDGPLMAVNFARAASLDFTQLDKEVLRRNIVSENEREKIDDNLDDLATTFLDDLSVAEERSLAPDEQKVIETIKDLFTQWQQIRKGDPGTIDDQKLDEIAQKIIGRFDVLTELIADHSFIDRRKAVWSISYFKYVSAGACGAALLISAAITFFLTRRIVRPLATAAKVADRIADGELQTPIPSGGRDETGILLHSMTVMQDNIRVMVEREKAQRMSAQNRLIDALESSHEGMILTDADNKIVIANSQMQTFFPDVATYMVPGSDFLGVFALIRPLLARRADTLDDTGGMGRNLGDAALFVGEYQLTDGRWIRVSRSDTHDGGFFLFLSDYTDIKLREEHYKKAKIEAEAANTAKTNFLANMSHELRTPLNAINGFSEIIAGQMFGSAGNPKYVDYANDILRSGRHLLEIITSVLDLAKSEVGKLNLNPEVTDLRGVLGDCATMVAEQCQKGKLRFAVIKLDEPLHVFGEPSKLRQIVINLLSNAIKFTDAGGTVSLHAEAISDEYCEIRVSDTGIGMSDDDLKIALTPFGQVDSSLARRYEGTGLGLPLTKALVELHGGTMRIESQRGKGTSVIVSIPRRPDHGAAEAYELLSAGGWLTGTRG